MKKILGVSLFAMTMGFGPHAVAKNWYMGAGLGWLQGNASTAVETTTNAGRFEGIRSQFSDTSTLGAVFVGHTFRETNYNWFVQARGFLDNSSLKKTVRFNALTVNVADATTTMRRLGTLAFDGGVSKSYGTFDVSFQLSALLSKFDVKFDDVDGDFVAKGSQYAWAIAPGVGAERDLGKATLGIRYEYQIYAPIKFACSNLGPNRTHLVNSKPRYHALMMTLSKSL